VVPLAIDDDLTALLLRFFANKAGEARMELVQRTLARLPANTVARVDVLRIAVEVLREFRAPTPAIAYDGGIFVVLARVDPTAAYDPWRRAVEARRTLPLDCQIVIELYEWEGLDREEIAQVLDTHEYTVRAQLMRGRRSVQERLGSPGR
jgi:hypothetical protein